VYEFVLVQESRLVLGKGATLASVSPVAVRAAIVVVAHLMMYQKFAAAAA
jgi:hypothetical protein